MTLQPTVNSISTTLLASLRPTRIRHNDEMAMDGPAYCRSAVRASGGLSGRFAAGCQAVASAGQGIFGSCGRHFRQCHQYRHGVVGPANRCGPCGCVIDALCAVECQSLLIPVMSR
jgi:hypothetical protein